MIIPDFSLNQNYPNPFNTSTIISYDIDYESPVRTSLCIYNLLGQRVRSLLDEEKSAGHYQVEWDGTNEKGYSVSSGLYFYVLKADKSIDKKKMLLIK
jgi:flagellar hook assembly protein FlgD